MKRRAANTPAHAGTVLNKILDKYGLKKGLSRRQVAYLWPRIVSPAIARHARIERITEKVVYIAVDSSVWMNEIAALKELLLAKINKTLSPGAAKFEDIRFAQRSWGFGAPKTSKAPEEPVLLDERDQRRVHALLQPLGDEDVRAVVQRLIEKDLKLKKSRQAAGTKAGYSRQ
ncbi:MAG: DciA family protein [Desulfomonilaceae bacterium]